MADILIAMRPNGGNGTILPELERRESTFVSIDRLYPDADARSVELNTALRLTLEASSLVDDAISAQREGNDLASDDCVNRLELLLQELFCCRRLGDGFAIAVNDLSSALRERRGALLQLQQLHAVKGVVDALRARPFMSADAAVGVTELLEAEGLHLTPPELDELTDSFDTSREER